ncbi:hypothetical protein [Limnohabitans curvus]|uniref:hypothetical protein n=1 Tax=Limnohabitans curvus TaxID=323423 RepID=UPI0011B29063|nr:hypothetical protein [Limnohabitans curvus]
MDKLLPAKASLKPAKWAIKFRLFDFIGEAIEGLECKVVSLGEELVRIKTDAQGALPDIKAKDALDTFELWVTVVVG